MGKKVARETLQAKLNDEAMTLYNAACCEVPYRYAEHRLRSCQATVIETSNFTVLKSYYTIVCFIDKRTDIMYDVLRTVYGYTATSAQHIAKFKRDYFCRECIVAR